VFREATAGILHFATPGTADDQPTSWYLEPSSNHRSPKVLSHYRVLVLAATVLICSFASGTIQGQHKIEETHILIKIFEILAGPRFRHWHAVRDY
ncbi:hypothetical protein BJX63DRAFT_412959, partial [Aspergillus granulosus]